MKRLVKGSKAAKDFMAKIRAKKGKPKTKQKADVAGWNKGSTRFIEKGEKPLKGKSNVRVQRRVVNPPKGAFFDFKNINGMNTNQIDLKNKKTDTYDIVFNNDSESNNKGFSQTLKYCKDYIKSYNGTGFSYFGEYIGGVVQIINNRTGLVVYETQVKIIKKNRI
jgi:hypothetical protein